MSAELRAELEALLRRARMDSADGGIITVCALRPIINRLESILKSEAYK